MFTRILSAFGFERRDHNANFLPGMWNRAVMPSGAVSASAVLSNLAGATACVRVKGETIASLPLHFFERRPNGDRSRVGDGLARVLRNPNPHQTGFEFVEMISRHLDLHGNFYARVDRNAAGEVAALVPLHPTAVSVERAATGNFIYRVSEASGLNRVYLEYEILHVRNHSVDGLIGLSPIQIARGVLSRAIAENITAETMAANSFRARGVITVPNAKVSPDSRKALSKAFEEDAMRPDDAPGIKVLEGGAKFEKIAFSSVDSQFLQSRTLSSEDVARVFGVPPATVGIASSVSYGSAEADRRQFVDVCIAPLCARIESAMERTLLSDEDRERYFIEFQMSGLLRGNGVERWNAHRVGREIGVLSVNEIRRIENLPDIPGGDEYLQPAALAGSSTPHNAPYTE
ncbi:phage portal protein [Hyphomonas sp.]|uniref:phage portal protein n=1 Tax=Hyphomonas sp. TaxID=87 RepID=UPI00391B7AA9